MASLELRGLVKDFGATRVIHGVDLVVADGQFTVFVGPSGCGKSTLLRLVCGLEEATGGDILIDGQRVNHLRAADRGLAMVFQSYALYPHMTVWQNMAFGLQNIKLDKAEVQRRVQAAAQLLRLDALLQRKPTQLSGGQRQRVAIGRAIVREPGIFLFDEPLSNLDAELRVATRGEISGLHQRLRTTMIYVTHDQVEAMTMADQIVVLNAGRIEQAGPPLALYNRPANRFVAGFIGSPAMNFIPVQALSGSRVKLPDGGTVAWPGLAATGGQPLVLGVRPEHLAMAEGAAAAATDLTLKLNVQHVEQLGSLSLIHGALAGTSSDADATKLRVQLPGQVSVRAGEQLALRAPLSLCHLFADGTNGVALPAATVA